MTSEKKTRVAVLFGGVSSEHEISLMSVESVLANLPDHYEVLRIGITKDGRWVEYTGRNDEITSQKWEQDPTLRTAIVSPDRSHRGVLLLSKEGWELVPVDICFPVLHGKHGEDGTIQGLFQLAGIPFVGCDTISSANCMDKEITHTILEAHGIKMAKWLVVNHEKMQQFEQFAQQAEEKLGYPMFVKPANAGSSVGVGKAHNRQELKAACETALKEDYKAVVEECIEMQEVETAVLGNVDAKAAGVVGELVPVVEFYTYEAKYIDGTTVLHIPGRVSEAKRVMDWVAGHFAPGEVLFSLMSQYLPWGRAAEFPELNRRLRPSEARAAADYMAALGLEGFTQEPESAEHTYIPPFDLTGV